MWNAECGMRSFKAGVVRRSTSHFNSALHIPHSALGGEGGRCEDRRALRHPPPRLGGRRLQKGGGGEGRGGGVRRGPRAAGERARRPHGRRGGGSRTAARAPRQVSAEARVQWLRVVPR